MDPFYERLIVRAATIDELLSDEFETLPGQKGDAELAGRRLAAWCQACASGDWTLFDRRLERDGLSIGQVLARFATVRRKASAPPPVWIEDAIWIEAAFQNRTNGVKPVAAPVEADPCPFEHLFASVVEQAEAKVCAGLNRRTFDNLTESSRVHLRLLLLKQLSDLCAPALYQDFRNARAADGVPADAAQPQTAGTTAGTTAKYDQFISTMQTGGFRRLFEAKPILLRLIVAIVRQWIDMAREFVTRLGADLPAVRRDILHCDTPCRVATIEGALSDPHNGGRSVLIVGFEDGARVVYKPKDLRLDAAWHALVGRLNTAGAPIALKAMRALPRDGYGWTEFIDHTGCADAEGCRRFFHRAGAWLALLHCFVGTDMHQENVIAAGEHPVPIDLEMVLQGSSAEQNFRDPEAIAFETAMRTIEDSVMAVGLLPAYGKFPNNEVFAVGGMISDWVSKGKLAWTDINSDGMRPAKKPQPVETIPNLPHVDGRCATLRDHIDAFVSGFQGYAKFLQHFRDEAGTGELLNGLTGVPVRKVVRPTRFYYMLLQCLKDHRRMEDGIVWSAEADFLARLVDWERKTDVLWPLQRAERSALLALNVPHFVSLSDGNEVSDAAGIAVRTEGISGIERARTRIDGLHAQEIAWQVEIIRQSTNSVLSPAEWTEKTNSRQSSRSDGAAAPTKDVFLAEADNIAAEFSRLAIRRGPGAAWIGLDWLGDSKVFNLVALGSDLYNGVCGLAVFLAAHAAVRRSKSSEELALAAVSYVRKSLRGRNSASMARTLGTGGASGLGSIVYSLAVMAKCLHHDDLLLDAQAAAELFTDELIAADKHLDVTSGSAGAILGLLRLYRDTRSDDVLKRATKCGEHLLAQPRVGPEGLRNWGGQVAGAAAINGMAHGAAGFALALASLASATGRDEFAKAASEWIAFENSSFDPEHNNWPDIRAPAARAWHHKWCHGATGIGLARIAMRKQGERDCEVLARDVRHALISVERNGIKGVDTLCCGTLASIEFFCEAGAALGRDDLIEHASRRLMEILELAVSTGDYEWGVGSKQFNLGLFKGLAGVGYTCLRRVDPTLPNILVWQ